MCYNYTATTRRNKLKCAKIPVTCRKLRNIRCQGDSSWYYWSHQRLDGSTEMIGTKVFKLKICFMFCVPHFFSLSLSLAKTGDFFFLLGQFEGGGPSSQCETSFFWIWLWCRNYQWFKVLLLSSNQSQTIITAWLSVRTVATAQYRRRINDDDCQSN